MKFKPILITIIVLFSMISCDMITQAYNETFANEEKAEENTDENFDENLDEKTKAMIKSGILEKADSKPIAKEVNLFESAGNLEKIQAQLQDMFPGKDLKVNPPHIYFEKEQIRLQLIDPEISENIDWYHYEGKTSEWKKGNPVKTNAHMPFTPVSLDEFKFETANKVYLEILKKLETIEGGEFPSTLYFSFHQKKWNWNARIYGSRSDYDFKTDVNGNELEFKRL